jgi:plasmid maintenance system antidote protein VapI
MNGLDLKAEAVRAAVPLYRVAAAARINPSQLSRLLNNRTELDADTAARISAAIDAVASAGAAA